MKVIKRGYPQAPKMSSKDFIGNTFMCPFCDHEGQFEASDFRPSPPVNIFQRYEPVVRIRENTGNKQHPYSLLFQCPTCDKGLAISSSEVK